MSERQKILEKLEKLSEHRLRTLMKKYSERELGDSADIHGSGEHGVDVVTFIKPERDPLGLRQVLLFQVKKSKVTLGTWRNTLSGQLAEMYFRTIQALNISEMSPRRIILIYADMTPDVHRAISNWNQKLLIPIEMLSLNDLASLLEHKGYKARQIRQLSA